MPFARPHHAALQKAWQHQRPNVDAAMPLVVLHGRDTFLLPQAGMSVSNKYQTAAQPVQSS